MNKNEKAFEELKKGIANYVDNKIDKSPFDKTFTAIVIGGSVNKYKIILNGKEYTNIFSNGAECSFNEVVKVKVPQNNYTQMYIEKSVADGGSGGKGRVTSVNGKDGDVILDYGDVGADKSGSADKVKEYADTQLNTKVDKVDGKGLSTNDFTNEYKAKLDKYDLIVKEDGSLDLVFYNV